MPANPRPCHGGPRQGQLPNTPNDVMTSVAPSSVGATFRARFRADARGILQLGGPLIVNNVAIAGMGFTDAVMAGQLGALDLAAVAVGTAVWMFVYFAGLGTLMALSPLAAHAYGAGENERVGLLARQA